ncbi:unnamed protein product [Protopolystoma xenopodis]|uniref:Uncharacterized protein n=1 Tax=Protopolystoma xenopodis TaxID=117903 RepID=A0A3S4ZG33_9PLAT|nr:unnamed protein product [Protopolystoma xenopodis]
MLEKSLIARFAMDASRLRSPSPAWLDHEALLKDTHLSTIASQFALPSQTGVMCWQFLECVGPFICFRS